MTTSGSRKPTETSEPHVLEWVTGTLSCILVGAMIGWIAWQAITATEEPPRLSARVTETRVAGELYRVEFEVENAAPTTAAAVTVAGQIMAGDRELETAETVFDYVPAHSKARGALLFRQDPGANSLRIRPTGYTEP